MSEPQRRCSFLSVSRVQLRSSFLLATRPAAGEAERFDLTAEDLVQELRNA